MTTGSFDRLLRGLLASMVLSWTTTALAATVSITATDKDSGPLDHVVVYLEPADGHKLAGHAPLEATVAQQAMQFAPYVTVVGVGAKVTFPNLDGVPHHIKSFSAAKEFEFKVSSETPPPVTMDQAGVIALNCLIHDWMRGYIVVVDTPYYAIADESGTAKIVNVPAGSYVAHAWHPDLGNFFQPLEQPVVVSATDAAAVFKFPFAPKPKKKMHPV